jgi:hypothetical protein
MRQIGSAALDAKRKSVMTLQTMLSFNIDAHRCNISPGSRLVHRFLWCGFIGL